MNTLKFNGNGILSWLEFISKLRTYCVSVEGDVCIYGGDQPFTSGQMTAGACLKEHFRRYGLCLAIEGDSNSIPEKVNEPEIELQGNRIAQMLIHNCSRDKDYSAVALGLTEALYNVKDHSCCNGNAFFSINFNKETKILDITVCDFGEGIPATIRKFYPEVSDEDALQMALKDRFSTHSRPIMPVWG